mgnify:CR=1 FL=1
MSESEENKRKTWLMFKKSDKSIPFTTNIIPKFNKALTATDENGTWEIKYSYNSNEGNAIYGAFDHSYTVTATSYKTTSTTYTHYITLKLPDGLAISPETIVSKVKQYYNSTNPYTIYVTGLNKETNAWETLTESHTPSYKSGGTATGYTTYTDNLLTEKQYYTQFRFYIKKTKSTTSAENGLMLIEYEITKGRYKKI